MLDEDVLRLYEKNWSQYKSMCAQLNGSCSYVNRHWVRREFDSGRRDVCEIDPVRYF
jgi:cullin 1